MMMWSEVLEALGLAPPALEIGIEGVSIDTRSLSSGDLFIALEGPNFDGHDFVEQAEKAGAVAVLATRALKTTLPCAVVPNTYDALTALARAHRAQMDLPMVAITGSCGKTTTRALLESIFSQCGSVLASQKSYNNSIGVPLTLLALTPEHDYAVVEIGMNQPGEIAELVALAQPDSAIVTNVAAAHLAGLGSVEAIAREKGSIFSGLGKTGTAMINQDDDFSALWHELASPRPVVTFGIQCSADVMAKDLVLNAKAEPSFRLIVPEGEVSIQLPLLGEHNVANALAAAAAAVVHGVSIDAIKAGLESVQPVARRLIESKGLKGATIIDDSYNANPRSLLAAINLLVKYQGNPVLVLGDMLELGPEADAMHRAVGEYALRSGVSRLYCYGPHSRLAAEAFGQGAVHFDDQVALLELLRQDLQAGDTVLVKGSNSMGMNSIVLGLQEDS